MKWWIFLKIKGIIHKDRHHKSLDTLTTNKDKAKNQNKYKGKEKIYNYSETY